MPVARECGRRPDPPQTLAHLPTPSHPPGPYIAPEDPA